MDDLSRSLQLKDEEMMDLLDAKSTQLKVVRGGVSCLFMNIHYLIGRKVVTEKHAQDLKEKENNHLREVFDFNYFYI